MMKRVCPKCGMPNFSAAECAEYWTCCRCGAHIGIEYQDNLEEDWDEEEQHDD